MKVTQKRYTKTVVTRDVQSIARVPLCARAARAGEMPGIVTDAIGAHGIAVKREFLRSLCFLARPATLEI